MSKGGIVYFFVKQNGKPLSSEQVADKMSMKRKDELEKAIRKHFATYCPAIDMMQVEFNDYGCLVDFAAGESINMTLPDLEVVSGKQTFTIMFDKVSTSGNDNNNNNNNMNGGRRNKTRAAKRSAKRTRKGTRRN